MKEDKTMAMLENLIRSLKNEKNYLLRYRYILKGSNRNDIKKLTEKHKKIKQDSSIFGKMEENNQGFSEVTFFEIIPPSSEKSLHLFKISSASTTIEFLDKFSLYGMILPIMEGTETEPLIIFK